ncbi:MAG: SpoIIE family protein phosphatase [Bacteroidales bacterium]|nr:SpoIIE family protein phosphatase [Bacteroidales bacterium]
MRSISVFLVLFFSLSAFAQADSDDDAYFDSIYCLMERSSCDTTRLFYLDKLAQEHYNVDSVMRYSQMLLSLAKKKKNASYEVFAESYLYWAYYYMNDYVSALQHAFRGAYVSDSTHETSGLAKNYHNIAIVYSTRLMDATKADDYYHKALDLYRQRGDSSLMCDVLRDIGNSNYLYEMFDKAEECYLEALHIDSIIGNKSGVAEDHMGMASTALAQCEVSAEIDVNVLEKAKREYKKALDIAADADYEFVKYIVSSELPEILMTEYTLPGHARQALLDSSRVLIDRGYEYVDRYGYDSERFVFDFNKIWYLALSRKFAEAQHFADSIKTLIESDPVSYKDNNYRLYKTLTRMYKAMGRFEEALSCSQLSDFYYRQERKKDYAITATQSMAQAKFDEQMQIQKNRETLLEAEAKQQRMLTLFAVVSLLIVSLLAAVVVRFWFASRRANEALDLKNCELEQQKEEIIVQNECLEQQNEQIEQQKRSLLNQNDIITKINEEMTSSINYASVIQRAAMPSDALMSKLFGDNLVLLRPLSIVSGDFYWAAQVGHYKMLAVADCTGHGVPGAFLSMLGMSILGHLATAIGNVEGVTAASVLDDVRGLFKASLHQNIGEESTSDGMDMALLLIDLQKNIIHYAGAYRPMILIHDGEVVKYEADHMPIGVHYNEKDHFTNHIVDAQKGDVVYMFSDGLTDQFGYDPSSAVHKFTARRLRSLLADIHKLPFGAQKVKIEATIDNWRLGSMTGDQNLYEQTDDAVIVGIRI